jgi:hypothetical protein
MLRGADAFAAAKTDAPGIVGDEPKVEGPEAELAALTAKCATAEERLAVVKSEKGRALYTQIELNKKNKR